MPIFSLPVTYVSLVWMYGSQLETGSTRFTRPGDFFTYIAFVELVIVVCLQLYYNLPPFSSFFFINRKTSAYLPVQFILAETVPGTEGDYPCTSAGPSFAKLSKGLFGV